jgi:hypothetical protein
MSFYSDASLALIPSGYKNGKVYSALPTDGSGDLTFTRASNATRVASNGLIEKVRTNLSTYSEDFANAAWSPSDITVTSNTQLAPNGTTTADVVMEGTGTAQHRFQKTLSLSSSFYTFSVYAKNISGTRQAYIDLGPLAAYFTFSTETIYTPTGFASVQNVGSGWYRITLSNLTAISISSIYLGLATGNSETYTGNGTSSIAFWGAQFEVGDIATDYIPTTTTAVSVGPVSGLPRLDYLNSTCPRLLLEPQRTNVCLWSEQIDNAGWVKTNAPTITTNIATAPDGYGGADGLQAADGTNFKTINQNFTVSANSTVTASVFVKKETSETAWGGIGLVFQGSTTKTFYVPFNAVTGVGVVRGSILTGTIVVDDYGDYWRLMVTTTDNGSNTNLTFSYYGTLSPDGININTGAGSVRTIWGLQVEVGESYATSYIPTLSTSVTRVLDAASKSGISSLIGQTEGTIFIDFEINSPDSGASKWIFFLKGSGGVYIGFYTNGANKFIVEVNNGGEQFFNNSVSVVLGKRFKMALAYKQNDFAFYVDGVQIAIDNSGTVPTCSSLDYLFNTTASNTGSLEHNQTLLFKTRLSNSDLAAITTL